MQGKTKQVRFRNMVAYGFGDLFGGGSFFIIGTLFMVFLTDVVGLSPVEAGTIVALGKVWDALLDPTIGYISDHLQTKKGRRRVFFLFGIIPVAITFSMLWIPIEGSHMFKYTYFILAYLLFNTAFGMVMVPYNTLAAEMTKDYSIRSKMTGIRMVFSQGASFLGAFFPKRIIDAFPGEQGYLIMGIIFGLLFALPWIFVYKGTWDSGEVVERKKKSGFWLEFKQLFISFGSAFKNKSFNVYLAMYLASYIAMDVFNALFFYFIAYYMLREAIYADTLSFVQITQVLFIPLVTYIAIKLGNKLTYNFSMIIWGTGIVLFSFLTTDSSLVLIYLAAFFLGSGHSGAIMIPWNVLPFVSDVDEMITTKRREGVYAGLMSFIRKSSQALAIFLVGVALKNIGYVPNAEQSASTLAGLQKLFMIVPAILILAGIIATIWFKISPENHKILLAEIQRRKKGGGAKDVTPEAQAVCESLTGYKYEQLWKDVTISKEIRDKTVV
ncbi:MULTISPECIES: MFS transporter [Priestia]|uniref:MFS transporter n=1 Tax=Priestia TaxID=2800373 RepID=UPI00040BC729|nr:MULTISPECIES: MFS transporter [Priestia]ANF46887.1 MFS transporter [Priestia megaterium]AQU74576.1 MFS transporter [Priestia megaterium]MCU7763416.1 MFS transporter [Priestia megaterium]